MHKLDDIVVFSLAIAEHGWERKFNVSATPKTSSSSMPNSTVCRLLQQLLLVVRQLQLVEWILELSLGGCNQVIFGQGTRVIRI